jgi:hypothetical protein
MNRGINLRQDFDPQLVEIGHYDRDRSESIVPSMSRPRPPCGLLPEQVGPNL